MTYEYKYEFMYCKILSEIRGYRVSRCGGLAAGCCRGLPRPCHAAPSPRLRLQPGRLQVVHSLRAQASDALPGSDCCQSQ